MIPPTPTPEDEVDASWPDGDVTCIHYAVPYVHSVSSTSCMGQVSLMWPCSIPSDAAGYPGRHLCSWRVVITVSWTLRSEGCRGSCGVGPKWCEKNHCRASYLMQQVQTDSGGARASGRNLIYEDPGAGGCLHRTWAGASREMMLCVPTTPAHGEDKQHPSLGCGPGRLLRCCWRSRAWGRWRFSDWWAILLSLFPLLG